MVEKEKYINKMKKLKEIERKIEDYEKTTSITHKNPVTQSIVYEIPQKCIDDFGIDLDKCSTQQNEGCGRCNLISIYRWKVSKYDTGEYIFSNIVNLENELKDVLSNKEIKFINDTIIKIEKNDTVEFQFNRIDKIVNIKFERLDNIILKQLENLKEFNGW